MFSVLGFHRILLFSQTSVEVCLYYTYHCVYFTVEDLEMHDGSAEKPYFMSKGLMKIIGKKNKFQDPDDGNKQDKKTKGKTD